MRAVLRFCLQPVSKRLSEGLRLARAKHRDFQRERFRATLRRGDAHGLNNCVRFACASLRSNRLRTSHQLFCNRKNIFSSAASSCYRGFNANAVSGLENRAVISPPFGQCAFHPWSEHRCDATCEADEGEIWTSDQPASFAALAFRHSDSRVECSVACPGRLTQPYPGQTQRPHSQPAIRRDASGRHPLHSTAFQVWRCRRSDQAA
jgi:hypothetical protein